MTVERDRAQQHRFGGAWTELKLEAVTYYLEFFTKVLANQPFPDRPFELWYIDAFAGSGTRQVEAVKGGLLQTDSGETHPVDMAGSVLHALDITPPFKRLVFIEGHGGRFKSLEAIKDANPARGIACLHGDANVELTKILGSPPWNNQKQGRGSHRAVCFLDPYGMAVDWETLRLLAETCAVDVWYLFPLEAVTRQLAGKLDRVDENKQRRLDEVFGTSHWREQLYETESVTDMFDETFTTATRAVTKSQIEQYSKNRLSTLFRYVSDPLPLFNENRRQIFSLFCLSNSVSDSAIGLIKKGVSSVLKKYGPGASRRTSSR